ncbi:unnamed protein product [Chondrus crispus]|uniref:DDE Tnp4 domain-containing protein n=1 Tax=Chondrus crispus TaxID=2769 RepID=R7QH09_CHOCR|nr:unnamed protein product [Chondrus crispus]CDF36756.1 unnamed protein product [Chondrus crispus]|eukprot:XP_005716575.1 unnamed protein product [Chondrus crispus]
MHAAVTASFFKRLYRMPLPVFLDLAEKLVREYNGPCRRSCPLLLLSVTIRWLAGGSYLDLSVAHSQPPSSIYYYIDQTLDDLDLVLPLSFPYSDLAWLEKVSDGFSRGVTSVLRGCCGALDGIAIKIKEPSRIEVPNSSSYYNRKGFFALNVQAICDSFYRCTYVGCLAAGSTHDSTAYSITSLAALLAKSDSGLHQRYWVAADDAYTCSERLLTPWPGRGLSTAKDCFNYWQSSARIFIEQAFGMLVARWGCYGDRCRATCPKVSTLSWYAVNSITTLLIETLTSRFQILLMKMT